MGPRATPIGDAAIARDALSSQGLALGIGGALHAVSTALTGRSPGPARNVPGNGWSMRGASCAMINGATFGNQPLWSEYVRFLRNGFDAVLEPTR